MKTLRILSLVAALAAIAAVGGCEKAKAVRTALGNVMTQVQAKLCPDNAQKAEGQAAVAYLEDAFAVQIPDDLVVDFEKAINGFDFVRTGICLAIPQVQAVLAAFDRLAAMIQKRESVADKALRFVGAKPGRPALTALRAAAGR